MSYRATDVQDKLLDIALEIRVRSKLLRVEAIDEFISKIEKLPREQR